MRCFPREPFFSRALRKTWNWDNIGWSLAPYYIFFWNRICGSFLCSWRKGPNSQLPIYNIKCKSSFIISPKYIYIWASPRTIPHISLIKYRKFVRFSKSIYTQYQCFLNRFVPDLLSLSWVHKEPVRNDRYLFYYID